MAKDIEIKMVPDESMIVAGFKVNEKLHLSPSKLAKAVSYGMMFQIDYANGTRRIIQPMTVGYSSEGKLLVRAWHLVGSSRSGGKDLRLEWRLFRFDRVKTIMFTGLFFTQTPPDYKTTDQAMGKGVIAYSDIRQILRNQKSLGQLKVLTYKSK